jgi:hypothetical protein
MRGSLHGQVGNPINRDYHAAVHRGAIAIFACLLILSGCGGNRSTNASVERCINGFAKTRTQPNHFAAAYEASSKTTEVRWEGPVYPPLPKTELNYTGSGVASYSYRYRLGNNAWSGWHKTKSPKHPGFTITTTKDRGLVTVEVRTIDDAGHMHHAVYASLTPSKSKPVTVTEAATYSSETEECGEAPL